MITCECSQCDERLWAEDTDAGRKIKCPKCGAAVKVPDPATSPPVVRVEHPALQNVATAWSAIKWSVIIVTSLGVLWWYFNMLRGKP